MTAPIIDLNKDLEAKASEKIYSNSELGASLLPPRSPSWVKQRKPILEQIFYWAIEDIRVSEHSDKTRIGSYTEFGRLLLQRLLDYTGDTKMGTKRGKPVEVPKEPGDVKMSVAEFSKSVWQLYGKPAPEEFSLSSKPANNRVTDRATDRVSDPLSGSVEDQSEQGFSGSQPSALVYLPAAIDAELVVDDFEVYDPAPEAREDLALFSDQATEALTFSIESLLDIADQLGDNIGIQLESAIVKKATAGIARGIGKVKQTAGQAIPQQQQPEEEPKSTNKKNGRRGS
ncbi:MAG TPA: hypothetical protein V6C57_19680 [Coleofasciculaceae cyanobacterium]